MQWGIQTSDMLGQKSENCLYGSIRVDCSAALSLNLFLSAALASNSNRFEGEPRYKGRTDRSACHLLLNLVVNRNRTCDSIQFFSFRWPKRCVSATSMSKDPRIITEKAKRTKDIKTLFNKFGLFDGFFYKSLIGLRKFNI